MHENEISGRIIGYAIEVHRELGPGLLESVYEEALCHEFNLAGLSFKRQQSVPIPYKGVILATPLRLDLWVENKVIVDVKAVSRVPPVEGAKLLTYLRLSKMRLGLLLNFHMERLKDGIERVVNDLPED